MIATTSAAPTRSSSYQKYDDYFKKYTERYFGDRADWRLFKAQAIVESGLRPTVVSPVGARGIMQIMPATYGDIRKHNPDNLHDIDDPESNIAGGIWYAHQEWTYWERNSDSKDHDQFMFGSYNAGRGPLKRAQKLAASAKMNEKSWPTIEKVAPQVSNWRYRETLAYVIAVYANLDSIGRGGEVKGETISKDDGDASTLPDRLKGFLTKFKPRWKPDWSNEILGGLMKGVNGVKKINPTQRKRD